MSEIKFLSKKPDSFIHSLKTPKFYKVASNILQLVIEKEASLKGILFDKNPGNRTKHPNINGIYALVVSSIQNGTVLDRLVRESQILMNERLDPWLARVLIAELLWGKKKLPPSEAKPIVTVLEYQSTFLRILRDGINCGTHENERRQKKADLKPRYIRVNTLLMSVGDAITAFRHEGWRRATASAENYPSFLRKLATLEEDEFLQDFHVKQLFAFPPRTKFFEHELYRNGSLILQDKATCLAPLVLNPTPGSAVLDMCAAPGIKTTQLAAIMENTGTLYAVEQHALRYKTLCEFVPRHGVTCVQTIQADATTLTPEECRKVEYVLVDPTCSGSGMIRPTSTGDKDVDPERLKQLAAFQVILLERALTKFPAVRRVVYSTCSVHPEENEQVVEEVLALVNTEPGRPRFRLAKNVLESWPNRGSSDYEVGPHCLVAHPDKDMTTGFFVAVFELVESGAGGEGVGNKKRAKKHKKENNARKGISKETDENGKVSYDQEISRDDKKAKKRKRVKSENRVGTGNDGLSETGVERKKHIKKGEIKKKGKVADNGVDIDDQEGSGEGKKKKNLKRKSIAGITVESGKEDKDKTGRTEKAKERAKTRGKWKSYESEADIDGHKDSSEGKKKKKECKKEKHGTV